MPSTTNVRTEREIERDAVLIADWYIRGWTHLQMTDALNAAHYEGRELSRRMISYDVQKMLKRWRDKAVGDVGVRKAEELARIDRLETEYWEAWDRSKESSKTVQAKKGGESQTVIQTVKDSDGDPRYLQGVQWCIEQRCKIIGLYAPVRTNVTFGNLNDEQLIAYVKEQLGELGALAPGTEQAQAVPETESQDD